MAHKTNQAIYARDTDGAALAKLSKAALVDIATEALRLLSGECDTALTADQVRDHEIVSSVRDRHFWHAEVVRLAAKIAEAERVGGERNVMVPTLNLHLSAETIKRMSKDFDIYAIDHAWKRGNYGRLVGYEHGDFIGLATLDQAIESFEADEEGLIEIKWKAEYTIARHWRNSPCSIGRVSCLADLAPGTKVIAYVQLALPEAAL